MAFTPTKKPPRVAVGITVDRAANYALACVCDDGTLWVFNEDLNAWVRVSADVPDSAAEREGA